MTERAHPTPTAAASGTATPPLTDLQLAYLIGREAPLLGGTGCWLDWELESTGWDIPRLEHAWNLLIERHETLRAVFTVGTMRVLEHTPRFAITVHDLTDAPAEALSVLRETIPRTSSDPAKWPLFRVDVVVTRNAMHLFLGIDVLIADGAGFLQLIAELGELYADPFHPLPPLTRTFNDFLHERRQQLSSPAHAAAAAYWTRRLDTLPAAPELPTTGKQVSRSFFRRHARHMSKHEWDELQRRAAARGVRRVPAMMAAFSEVLARWAARREFCVNVTVGSRRPAAYAGVVGDFSTNLLLEVDCAPRLPFAERARRLASQLDRDLANVEFGGVEVLTALSRARNERVMMPVVFTSMLHRHATFARIGRFAGGISHTPQVTLDCQILETGDGLLLSWDVVDDVYPEGLAAAMFESWASFVLQLAATDAAWDEERHDLLPPAQRRRRQEVNATAVAWPAETLHGRVLEQSLRAPDRIAIVAPDRSLTYREVAARAAALAVQLQNAGAQRNTLVAIVLPRGWQQVVATLAVQMAGAAYLPIDAGSPPARIAELLRLGECRLAIATGDASLPAHVHRLPPDAGEAPAVDSGPATADDLAYVIFTSGSTGTPKGVMIRHRAAANTIRDINERFGVSDRDRVIALSSLNFDLSVWDIFGMLSAGGIVVIAEQEALRDPAALLRVIEEQRITIWNSVPSYLQMLAESRPDPQRLSSLRLALLSGDWIPVTLPGRLAVPIVSLGGATEASIWSIAYPIGRVDPEWKSIPYGTPLANQTFHVLDEHFRDCPDGVAGELYIGGSGLADGYWRDEERTAASFVTHPETGARMYRTGDWGRYLPDGNIEFLGRRDGQVKISGFRVELGEVEWSLTQCDGVDEAVGVTFVDEHGQKRLCAFYTGTATSREVRAALQRKLPAYMIPSRLIAVPSFPLSTNGKVDRKTLADRAATSSERTTDAFPRTMDRLFDAPEVLHDSESRKTFVAAAKGVRHDLHGQPRIALRADDDLPVRAERWTSVRDFTGTPTLTQLEALLGGLRAFRDGERVRRAYPSAGESWSVQTYVHVQRGRVEGLEGGIWYYHPLRHELIAVAATDTVETTIHVPANQRLVENAAFWIVFVADLAAIRPLYGDFAEPFAWMEAGHMAQILRQSAVECGLGLCLIGTFDMTPLRLALGLSELHIATGSMAGGIPGQPAETAAVPDATRLPIVSPAVSAAALEEMTAAATQIWRDALGVNDIRPDDRFFDVGGNSFAILSVQRAIHERFGREVSITDLFRLPTIADLALHLAGASEEVSAPPSAEIAGVDDLEGRRRSRREFRRAQREGPPK